MNILTLVAVIAALLALTLSIINAIRITNLKKKSEVDLVNHNEDINLSMESVKFTVSREIKNLRKEINKRQRNNPPVKRPNTNVKKAGENNEASIKTEKPAGVKKQPRKNYRRPANKQQKKDVKKVDTTETQS